MNTEQVLDIFRSAGAVLEGHFILTSGLRSPIFLQKARVFMHADKTEELCKALAEKISANVKTPIDYVVGPAIGGLIPAYETSRHLGVPAIWVEREGGEFRLRRFEIAKGSRVVIVEDIVTTGLSTRETIAAVTAAGSRAAKTRPKVSWDGMPCGKARKVRSHGSLARPYVAISTNESAPLSTAQMAMVTMSPGPR